MRNLLIFMCLASSGRLRVWAAARYGASVPNPSGTVEIEPWRIIPLWRNLSSRAQADLLSPARQGTVSTVPLPALIKICHPVYNEVGFVKTDSRVHLVRSVFSSSMRILATKVRAVIVRRNILGSTTHLFDPTRVGTMITYVEPA
jgi:hypothetical protein